MMEQKSVLNQALHLIQGQRRHRRWLRVMTGMAAVVVFVTTYMLILPAITMEHGIFEVTATPSEAALGETIDTEIYAEAEDGREETFFVLSADGDNAGLDESQLDFDEDGIAVIEDADGQVIDFHREYDEDGIACYWFKLTEGQSTQFTLPWVNGMDRYRAETIEEEVPIEIEEETPEQLPPETEPAPEETVPGEGTSSEESPVEPPESASPGVEDQVDSDTEESDQEQLLPETGPAPEETVPGEGTSSEESPVEPPESASPGTEDQVDSDTEESDQEQASDIPEEDSSVEEQPPSDSVDEAEIVQPEETPSAEEAEDRDQEPADDPLAIDSDAAFMTANISNLHYQGGTMQSVGAAPVSLSRHSPTIVTSSYATSTNSNAEAADEPSETFVSEQEEHGETQYEIVQYTEIVLDQSGDMKQEGTLTIAFGSGATIAAAQHHASDFIELIWSAEVLEELIPEIPEDATSWAIVEKEGFVPSASNAALTSSGIGVALLAENSGSHDFADNITSVTVSKLENGNWVPGTEFTDGDSVRVEINYTIPANTVGADNQTIHYQLPDGISLSQEESGTVYDGQTPVGSYVIGTDGLITITFADDFSDDKPFSGMIRFEGTLSADSSGGEQEIEFGGAGGTITVKPSASPTDIHVEKEGSYNKNDQKLHYSVTVSTTKGTEDTVTISDNFNTGNTNVAYDENSFQIIKVKADGTQETISGYAPEFGTAWQGGPEKFTISDLPKLEAGEKYIVTYTATPEKTSDTGGASSVSNNVTGTSGGDNSSNGVNVTISQQMLQKWGSYNSGTGKIQWTITLNPDKQDIGGYVLKDTMTIGGETVSIPEGTAITMTGSDGSSQTITLPYTFPEGSSDNYTITYETDAPQGEPGQSWSVDNKAELDGDGEHYEVSNGVTGQTQDYNVSKGSEGLDQNASTNEVGAYKWVARITVSKADVDLNSLTYTDTLIDASVDGTPVPDSHYTTAALLDKLAVTVNGTALIRGTDYQICDNEGNVITDFTAQAHLTGFQVKFLEAAKEKVIGQTIELRYQTQVDYTELTGDGTYTIVNKGSIPGHDSESSITYTPPKKLEKQASITGQGGNSYTDDPISIDYEASGGVIHYRLLIHTDESTQGDIALTDLLPRGAVLVEDSVKMAFYENDYYEYEGINLPDNSVYKASEHIKAVIGEVEPDGTTPVTFTIDEGYNGDGNSHILAVYYDVSIQDDPLWTENPGLEDHLYRNEVSWGSESAGTDVTVEREVPDIKKSGEQLPQYDANGAPMLDADGNPILSNTIRYGIIINAGAKDLNSELAFITLWDKLDVGSAAGAEFLPASVKLYHYDPTQENNCGREIDSSLYAYTYDETEYVLTFNLPDETACVLVYEYIIDRGTAAGDLHIKNEAHLTGGTSSGGSGDVILEDTSSSAIVTKKDLTIYKVDATNYGKLLPGAVFELEVYTKEKGWDTLLAELTTDENGQFVLIRDQDEHLGNFDFTDNTLYRLTETKPPAGYSANGTEPYYFVWVKDGMTADAVKQEMLNTGALGDVDAGSVQFLTTSGAMYIPNQPTELTVKKLWQDESGMAIPPGTDSVELILYQQAVDSNRRTVTVNSTGHQSWSSTHTSAVNVADGSSLTIQITGVYISSLDIQVGSGNKVSVSIGSGQVWTYTIDNITADTTVQISPTDQNEGNSFGNISFSGFTTPSYVPVGDAVEYKKVTLNADNNWSYTWNDLPKQNHEGQTVYYHVKEASPIPGFEVIYSANNNDGIQAGDLTVVNRANGYILPETGGPGISLFTAGGLVLMALAGLMYLILRRKGDETP